MADTGAPYFIPYVEPTDLVRDYPAADEASADAIAAALDAAGGLVAVHSVTKTDTFTVSTAERVPQTVTGLELSSIGMADATNKLVIAVFIGALASSSNQANVGVTVERAGVRILTGAASDNRVVLTSYQQQSGASNLSTAQPTIIGVISPGVTTAADFAVRILNMDTTTRTLFVNRTQADADVVQGRTASTFTILEVRA